MHFPPWTAEETPVTSSFIRERVCFEGCSVIIIEHKLESQGYSIEWQIIANQDNVAGYDCIRGYADSIDAAKEAAKAMLERINLLHRKDLLVQKDVSVRENKEGQLVILPKYDFNSKLYAILYSHTTGWWVKRRAIVGFSEICAQSDGTIHYWNTVEQHYLPETDLFLNIEEAQAECDERNKCALLTNNKSG